MDRTGALFSSWSYLSSLGGAPAGDVGKSSCSVASVTGEKFCFVHNILHWWMMILIQPDWESATPDQPADDAGQTGSCPGSLSSNSRPEMVYMQI